MNVKVPFFNSKNCILYMILEIIKVVKDIVEILYPNYINNEKSTFWLQMYVICRTSLDT